MSEPIEVNSSWWQIAVISGLGIAGYICRQIWKATADFFTGITTRIQALEDSRATTDDLEETESKIDAQLKEIRQEQRDRDAALSTKLDDGFRSVHERIDKIFERRAP